MQMTIPPVRRSREALPFKPTEIYSERHLPYVDDFCLTCGGTCEYRDSSSTVFPETQQCAWP